MSQSYRMYSSSKKVLIIEDNYDVGRYLLRILQKEGFSPILAHDGLEALDLARSNKFDLVITDLKLPYVSGIEIIKELVMYYPKMPIIVLSGHKKQEDIPAFLQIYINYLPKPVNKDVLFSTIRQTLI